ncbi:MAG TPA: exosortase-associated EpsI family protein, partial [Povalibacter sp.]|nr:exosortase-associated EpsI family protein [Povalibacter sp.]
FRGADAVVSGRYSIDGYDVELYRAVYESQRQGKELVAYDNSIFGGENVDVLNESVVDGWRDLEIATAVGHELVRYQYRIGSTRTADGLGAQLSYGIRSLVSAPVSEVVALRTRCESDCAGARMRIHALVDALGHNGSPP